MSQQLLSRRKFIKSAVVGAAGVIMLPQFFASCKQNSGSANDGVIRIGFIGLGQQAMYLLNGYLGVLMFKLSRVVMFMVLKESAF